MAKKGAPTGKVADFILTTILVLEVVYCLYAFFVTNIYDLYWFLAFCGLTVLAVKLTDIFCQTVMYNFVSGYLLANPPYSHPLSKQRAFKKFVGSAWQFVIHFSMTICEIYILSSEEWLQKPWSCFYDFLEFTPKQSLRLFFLLQCAIWICTGFSHRFNADAHMHKDYIPMYVHHLATIGLVAMAYTINASRIGIVVLIVHDASDIAIDLLKIFNYLRLEGKKGFFLVEIAYAATLALWAYFRLYYFPYKVIAQGTLGAVDMFGPYLLPEGVTPALSKALRDLEGPESVSARNTLVFSAFGTNILLILLFLLHIWWGALLLRILFRLMSNNSNSRSHDAGRQEYEGESDDEDNDTREKDKDNKEVKTSSSKSSEASLELRKTVKTQRSKKVD